MARAGAPPARPAVPPLEGGYLEAALEAGAAIFSELRRRVEASGEPCEGNILHTRNSWQLEPEMVAKQKNLLALARSLPARGADGQPLRILEVGFNAGHSVCLMLLANPSARVVAFDLCEHGYTQPCAEALRRHFGAHRLELYAGPSTETLPAYRAQHPDAVFDLLHIDGGHQYRVALSDMENCWRLARGALGPRSVVVLDDTDITGVRAVWSDFLAAGRVLEWSPPHALGEFQHGIGEFLPDASIEGLGACGACGDDVGAPYACGGCREVRYCGAPCARTHWKLHQSVCAARRPPDLVFPAIDSLVPAAALRAGPGGSLLAVRDLSSGEVLFEESPLSWQPERHMRAQLCRHCGAGARSPELAACGGCGQAVSCRACRGLPCAMCPELKITRGHVAPFTLLVLDLLRRREARALPEDAFVAPPEVRKEHREGAANVQKVGNWCSAVRWPDERAAEVLAATLYGKIDLAHQGAGLGVGYYPKFARLSAAGPGPGGEQRPGNVRMEIRPTPRHTFTLHAVLCSRVSAGTPVHLRSS